MNKNLLKICFVAALLIAASSAHAASNITGATVIGGGTFSPSNKVNIQAVSVATAYSAQSKNTAGDRELGTNTLIPKCTGRLQLSVLLLLHLEVNRLFTQAGLHSSCLINCCSTLKPDFCQAFFSGKTHFWRRTFSSFSTMCRQP
jgi:hypothetical protein